MARPTEARESETESLGFSAESDSSARKHCSEDARRSTSPAEDSDLQEYAKSLGVHSADADLAWVVREAFEAPLPTSWTEHVDAEGRVYFFNQVSEESTWSHPMDVVYRELIAFISGVKARTTPEDLERRAHAVREHLMEVHGRALAQLDGWSGPYNSDTGQYYYNERLEQSTWVNPINAWEYELAIRHSVLHRSLLARFDWPEEPPQPGEGVPDLLTTPWLHLPLGLARPEEDSNFTSARSFYTARESARSGTSSRSEQAVGEARAKRAPGTPGPGGGGSPPPAPAQALLEATRCAVDSDGSDGALEVTFGTTGALKMPVVEKR